MWVQTTATARQHPQQASPARPKLSPPARPASCTCFSSLPRSTAMAWRRAMSASSAWLGEGPLMPSGADCERRRRRAAAAAAGDALRSGYQGLCPPPTGNRARGCDAPNLFALRFAATFLRSQNEGARLQAEERRRCNQQSGTSGHVASHTAQRQSALGGRLQHEASPLAFPAISHGSDDSSDGLARSYRHKHVGWAGGAAERSWCKRQDVHGRWGGRVGFRQEPPTGRHIAHHCSRDRQLQRQHRGGLVRHVPALGQAGGARAVGLGSGGRPDGAPPGGPSQGSVAVQGYCDLSAWEDVVPYARRWHR